MGDCFGQKKTGEVGGEMKEQLAMKEVRVEGEAEAAAEAAAEDVETGRGRIVQTMGRHAHTQAMRQLASSSSSGMGP